MRTLMELVLEHMEEKLVNVRYNISKKYEKDLCICFNRVDIDIFLGKCLVVLKRTGCFVWLGV